VWDTIRNKAYSNAGHICEICGDVGTNQGVRHNVECHEIWEYSRNSTIYEQKLNGFVAICPYCHKTKHVGLARMRGEENIVIRQLMKVNLMDNYEARDYINQSFALWENRSMQQWELDISYISEYLKE
jgi:hypothetical protein